ncbi:sulfite exporter TauE/SafE family protein [Bacteroidetes/Chlorobi group bacterium ChocPot_Mid]|jgi:cytochrome c biogenesis protein CcdA|nr:MAG: sulfite exporter TauE/SafE family protein [Bacteroidetes/Chlorobi group bacterium ChocPot_Mid]
MEFITSGILIALWLGILTSISPCPLATNIAAISFVSKKVGSVSKILLTGMLYTFGRMLAYTLLSMVIIFSIISVPEIARFLQKYINIILGPLLIIVGLIMTNIIKFNLSIGGKLSDKIGTRAEKSGIWGGLFLGFIFALSFCPVSAGIFFGSLLPLSLKYNSAIILPFVYGIGTALPVLVFAVVISFSANYVGKVYNKLQKFEWWAQRITGILFILIGLYFIYRYWF